MLFRRFKLSHTRCFLPSFFLNRNLYDEEGTEVLNREKVGGWQGVVNAFSPCEDGNPSDDVRAISSTVCYSALMGGIYGSVSSSKRAFEDFFVKNQATVFQNQFDAQGKLQTKVSLEMFKGMCKWGFKVAIFCGPYTTIVTIINAYRQDVSVLSYATAGFIVGGLFRINFGTKGFAVGSTLGGILGAIVGCFTILMLKFSPMTMDELKKWQNDSQKERDEFFVKEQKQSIIFKYDKPAELLEHDERLQKSKPVLNDTT